MRARVIRVKTIPFGLSALVDEQPGSLVVWLLESEWSEARARLVEQALATLWPASGDSVIAPQPGLHAV